MMLRFKAGLLILGGALLISAAPAMRAVTADEALMMQGAASNNLGSVSIPRKVMADGKPLAAGTYTVRLGDQIPESLERWVEFVQGGSVKGREVCSLVPDGPEMDKIAEGARPAKGGNKVEMLKGETYLRVWINKAGQNYLIHLVTS